MKNIQVLVNKVLELVSEVETYIFYKENFLKSFERAFDDYQRGKLTYFQYEKAQKKILKGKTKEEWTNYYDAYVLSLLKRIETYNSQIFYDAYTDTSYTRITTVAPAPVVEKRTEPERIKKAHAVEARPAPEEKPKPRVQKKKVELEEPVAPVAVEETEQIPLEAEEFAPEMPEVKLVEVRLSIIDKVVLFFKHIFVKKEVDKMIDRIKADSTAVKKGEVTEAVRESVSGAAEEEFKAVPIELPEARPIPAPIDEPEKRPFHERIGDYEDDMERAEIKMVIKAPEKVTIEEKFDLVSWFKKIFAFKKVADETEGIQIGARAGETVIPETERQKKGEFDILENIKEPSMLDKLTRMWKKPKEESALLVPEEEFHAIKAIKTDEASVSMGGGLIESIRNMFDRNRKVHLTEDKSHIPFSTMHLETLRRKSKPEITAQIEKITATSLQKEAKRIRHIMGKRKALKIYQPSYFGAVANIAIKRMSLFLLDQFPEFFKDLYHALRLANIKILSNTYVNMMVLGTIASWFGGLIFFGMFFFASALPIEQIFFRTVMMSVLSGLAGFAGFYAYPYSKLKQRRRSINTNLPFAINHMAAVSSSGVAPAKMFKMISESKEYGEFSAEIEKIVNYVDIFGYDLLTALKSVAATSPSFAFKDFLEGMVSTTQTGGDLKSYFSQKAEEAMLNYKMERQEYTETIATYSDIYTGILIAAPLFFVAALSLVSLLGGKVGGMSVNTIIVIGTYMVIPFMNVAFLTFLELTQPEV
ncbi:MAG: type II secretion system F family protein [Candidatus Woesearchaeota archaeon]